MPEFKLPENFETYPEARKKAFLTMKELKEQGRRIVGVFCTFTPWELILAAQTQWRSCYVESGMITYRQRKYGFQRIGCPLESNRCRAAVTDKYPFSIFEI